MVRGKRCESAHLVNSPIKNAESSLVSLGCVLLHRHWRLWFLGILFLGTAAHRGSTKAEGQENEVRLDGGLVCTRALIVCQPEHSDWVFITVLFKFVEKALTFRYHLGCPYVRPALSPLTILQLEPNSCDRVQAWYTKVMAGSDIEVRPVWRLLEIILRVFHDKRPRRWQERWHHVY